MKRIDLATPPVQIVGAAWLERRADGVVPHRLPQATRHLHDLITDSASVAPSGVRIAFRSTTRRVELEMQRTLPHPTWTESEPGPATVDLVVDGERVVSQSREGGRILRIRNRDFRNPDVELVDGPPLRFCFEDLSSADKQLELWLPPLGHVEVRELWIDGDAHVSVVSDRRPRWLHYGSSISQCGDATSPARTWPAIAARRASLHLHSLGLAGACHLDPFVARYMASLPADILSLKLGINVVNLASMRERCFVPALHGLLETLREAHPRKPILVISPIFCPTAEDQPGPTLLGEDGRFVAVGDAEDSVGGALTLRRIRELLTREVERRRQEGDRSIHYLDGLDLFGEDDAMGLPDGLHPDGPSYERMGERFYDRVFAPGGVLERSS